MKTIVAGSRSITNYEIVEKAIIASGFQITELVSGAARGVDQLGERFAEKHDIPVKQFYPDWSIGKAAGHIRNEIMAEYADALILVWDGESSGSESMLKFATKRGLKIYEYKTSELLDLTFCLMSCDEDQEVEHRCLESINKFRDKIVFQEVRNIFPQTSALNKMITQCETKFLIPLDADFILYDNSFDRIKNAISSKELLDSNNKWHSILFPVWDVHTQKKIRSLKIFNTDVVKKIQYRNVRNPDAAHYLELTEKGYYCIDKYMKEDPICDHMCVGKRRCYFKYKDATLCKMTKNKEEAIKYVKQMNHEFNKLYSQTKNEDYLYSILGMYEGLISKEELKVSNSNEKVTMKFSLDQFDKIQKRLRYI